MAWRLPLIESHEIQQCGHKYCKLNASRFNSCRNCDLKEISLDTNLATIRPAMTCLPFLHAVIKVTVYSYSHVRHPLVTRLLEPKATASHRSHAIDDRRLHAQHRFPVDCLCSMIIGHANSSLHPALLTTNEERNRRALSEKQKYRHRDSVDERKRLLNMSTDIKH